MTLSFAATGDAELRELVVAIKNKGANVFVTTEESTDSIGTLDRRVVIEWRTHATDGRIIG